MANTADTKKDLMDKIMKVVSALDGQRNGFPFANLHTRFIELVEDPESAVSEQRTVAMTLQGEMEQEKVVNDSVMALFDELYRVLDQDDPLQSHTAHLE